MSTEAERLYWRERERRRRAAAPEAHQRAATERYRRWRSRNPDRVAAYRAAHTRPSKLRRYGLTPSLFDALLGYQGGRCAICRRTEPGGAGDFHVDHDHACCPGRRSCGRCVRGLLCARCNVGAGVLDWPDERLAALIAYRRDPPWPRLAVELAVPMQLSLELEP
jgi:hypothetical protein